MNLKNTISAIIGNPDKYLFAFANVHGLLDAPYSDFKYALSIARKLNDDIINEIKAGPTLRYFNEYKNVNAELSNLITKISEALSKENIKNLPIKPTFDDAELDHSYLETLRTPFSHKMAATRAGLGWIGKTDLLITHKFGPRVRLATILIDYENLETGIPNEKSKCGSCFICVDSCPAHAANGKLWDITVDRDDFYDAFKCRKKCRKLTKLNLNQDNSICGLCVAVCPVGNKMERGGS